MSFGGGDGGESVTAAGAGGVVVGVPVTLQGLISGSRIQPWLQPSHGEGSTIGERSVNNRTEDERSRGKRIVIGFGSRRRNGGKRKEGKGREGKEP